MNPTNEPLYCIPSRFRRMENMHIAFWLMKDISWCMIWKTLGIIMVIPTLSIAIWISVKNRRNKAELAHNLAIVFWISANAYWMISEFFHFDETVFWNIIEGRHLTLIPFLTGSAILFYYYVFQRREDLKNKETIIMQW